MTSPMRSHFSSISSKTGIEHRDSDDNNTSNITRSDKSNNNNNVNNNIYNNAVKFREGKKNKDNFKRNVTIVNVTASAALDISFSRGSLDFRIDEEQLKWPEKSLKETE